MSLRVGEVGYEKYAEQRRGYMRDYYQRNRAKILAQIKARGWSKPKLGKARGAAFHRDMVIALLRQRDGDNCSLCGLTVGQAEASVDHVELVAWGGTNEATNLRLTHLKCNLSRPKKVRT